MTILISDLSSLLLCLFNSDPCHHFPKWYSEVLEKGGSNTSADHLLVLSQPRLQYVRLILKALYLFHCPNALSMLLSDRPRSPAAVLKALIVTCSNDISTVRRGRGVKDGHSQLPRAEAKDTQMKLVTTVPMLYVSRQNSSFENAEIA